MRAKYTVLLPAPPDEKTATAAPVPSHRKEIAPPSGEGGF